ncbi:MAG: VWA domain-containing protein [Bacillota bacterium]
MPLTNKIFNHYLEENLAVFINLLRQEGLSVSTTEMFDALQALEQVDLVSRENFKSALQATLIKNSRDLDCFNRLFDNFFVPPEVYSQRRKQVEYRKKRFRQELEKAREELQFRGEPLTLSADELAQYRTMSKEQRERLQDFMHKTETGVNIESRFRPILESLVKSHLRYCRINNQETSKKQQDASGGGGQGDGAGEGKNEDELLREMDIQKIKESDLPEAEQLLQQLSRKLAVQILRRRYSGPRSGVLDLRRSLRENMRYGGTIFKLRHKPKRHSRQQILLLCDVSGSMKTYSTFVLHFLHGLKEAVRDLSCFTFADRLESLTGELKSKHNLHYLLDRVIRRSETWGGGTNLGLSLEELSNKYPDLLNARTSVIIVSDTKTISLNQATEELSKLKDRVRRVIWLNPLPKEHWPEYRSVGTFAELVEMWPCNTIAQLEEVLTGRL